MNIIERTNRQTEHLKRLSVILEKCKKRMGEKRFEDIMDEITKTSWKK